MSSVVERVARALVGAIGHNPDDQLTGSDRQYSRWELYVHDARAAIEAMPRAEIVQTIVTRIMNERSGAKPPMTLPEWRAFIDAALKGEG